MPEFIIKPWQQSEADRSDRSAGDRSRHRLKIREAIRKNIADIVAEEAIIGRSNDRIVKVPIRGIKEYQFVYGSNNPQVGEGTGDTQEGQVLGKSEQEKEGKGGKAGDKPGVDYYETDITLEELIDIMFEDLELPFQEQKKLREIPAQAKRKSLGYRKKGIRAHLSLYRTASERIRRLQNVKRNIVAIERLIKDRMTALSAAEERGDEEAIERLNAETRELREQLVELHEYVEAIRSFKEEKAESGDVSEIPGRFPFRKDDLRFRRRKEHPEKESNAVVICIMDTSGSMDTLKKYLARSFFFLLHSFVQTKYDKVEVAFVAHHTKAREVTEEEFFHKGESGGTCISSGYQKALEIIHERYHPSLWNIYAFHCSDGDNFDSDNEKALKAAGQLCDVCNIFGYGEIKPKESFSYGSSLMELFSNKIDSDNYKALLIENKEGVWSAFREFLQRERRTV